METSCALFPAQAGVNRAGRLVGEYVKAIPRAGGGEPFPVYTFPVTALYSPRRRG